MRNAATISDDIWRKSKKQKLKFWRGGVSDHLFLIVALSLAAFGLVMVYSASYIYAQERFSDGLYFFRRHFIFLAIGIACLFFFRFVHYRLWQKFAIPIFLASVFTLILVCIPSIGHKVGGARRWIQFAGFGFQPIELAKIAIIIFLADRFTRRQIDFSNIKEGFLIHLWPVILVCVLSLMQPDFGSAVLIAVTAFIMFYLTGVRIRYLFGSVLLALPVMAAAIMYSPYRRARLFAFLDPWADPQNTGFQIIQSFLAFYRGGFFGVGLGNSKEKLFYLPEAHNDFILSVIGEELGFLGVFLLCSAFLLLFFRGIKIAAKAEDGFGSILASGLIVLLGLEVFLNAGIVLGMLPTKGMNLPFISSGGTSIVCAMAIIGILLSVSSKIKNKANYG